MSRRDWTREELIVTFNLYCKIPFGRIHIRNPLIINLAKAIGRTPSAVSWKLANFARLDPELKKRNVTGATHGSEAEVEIWNEFKDNWEQRTFESERLLEKITGQTPEILDERKDFPKGKTRETIVRTRVNQGFFRAAILAAYGGQCCITGLSVVQLLNASHIVPWIADVKNRTNPSNGLCLNAIHDRAFDCGLLTITTDLKVKLSSKLKVAAPDEAVRDLLWRFENVTISSPRHFPPDPSFLRYHNEQIFLR
ncbi:MAG TPA: HNH endonuclease [Terriglobales bacterium]|nr:HNH endonuclease [Terriglobales bacterium]